MLNLDQFKATLLRADGSARAQLAVVGLCLVLLAVMVAVGQIPAALLGVLGLAIALFLIRWLAPTQEQPFLVALFCAAFAVRLVTALTTYYISLAMGQGGIIFPDEGAYDAVPWAMAQQWRGVGESVNNTLGIYTTLAAAVYFVSGHEALILKVLNAALGAGIAPLIWYLARLVFPDSRVGKIAGVLVVLFPSLILWTSLNLRDAFALFIGVCAIIGACRFFFRSDFLNWLLLVAPWALLSDVRYWVFLPLGWLFSIEGILAENTLWWRRVAVALVIGLTAVLLPYWAGWGVWGLGIFNNLSDINHERFGMARGAQSAFVSPVQSASTPPPAIPTLVPAQTTREVVLPSSPPSPPPAIPTLVPAQTTREVVLPSSPPSAAGAVLASPTPSNSLTGQRSAEPSSAIDGHSLSTIAHIPVGLVYVLASPFPWVFYNWWFRAAVPEMLLWYLLVALAVYGTIKSASRWRQWFLPAAYIGVMLLIMAMIEGNVGTAARHRDVIVAPFVFIFSAQGLVHLWERRRRHANE